MLVEWEAMQERKRKKGTYHQGFCRPLRFPTSPPAATQSEPGSGAHQKKIPQRSKGRKAQYGVEMECFWGGTVRCRNENKDDSQPCLRVSDNFCYLKVMFTSTPGVQTYSGLGIWRTLLR